MKTAQKRTQKDPVCGMKVEETNALCVERDGKTFYFCGDACRKKFLAAPAGKTAKGKSADCCGSNDEH